MAPYSCFRAEISIDEVEPNADWV